MIEQNVASTGSVVIAPLDREISLRLSALPEIQGVYAFRSAGQVLHLSWTKNLKRRITRLLRRRTAAPTKMAEQLADLDGWLECWLTGSALGTSLKMYELASVFFPDEYPQRLRLRMPWFVTLTNDEFPHLSISNRVTQAGGLQLGPFQSREAALRYEQAALSLFQIRRCTETLQPSVDHPGCIYGEMGLCLRPCQLAVSESEYRSESDRVGRFLQEGTQTMASSLSAARNQAAERLDFECASQIHRQMQKLEMARVAKPESVQPLDQFHGVAVTPGIQDEEVQLRLMLHGYWQAPVIFPVHLEQARSESLDARLRAALTVVIEHPEQAGNRMEQMAIFSRWFYSSSRSEDWFGFELRSGPPYRKLARNISRMVQAQTR